MGLTIHYSLTVPKDWSKKTVRGRLESLRQFCLDLPVETVSELREFKGKECEPGDKETDPFRWAKIQASRSPESPWQPGTSFRQHPSEATLAKQMLQEILGWFPDRKLVFIGDGAYSANNLLGDLDPRVIYVGVMRSDAALYNPIVPRQSKSKRGRKPGKGPRLPNPKEAVKKADGNRRGQGPWTWQTVKATAYGVTRKLQVLSFQALWPEVRGSMPILVLLVRDPQGKFEDKYLFTTDVHAELSWVISTFSRRWSIEVAFKASKQVMKIQAPQHWCQQSIEKLSPWVWLMQSVISLWYITEGRSLRQARAARRRFGVWDTEWSLVHMLRILRATILAETITTKSATKADLHQLLDALENYLHLAV
jgi:hypothetical protein